MLVFCEECGKKYIINPKEIEGSETEFECESCSHLIRVVKPDREAMPPPTAPGSPRSKATDG